MPSFLITWKPLSENRKKGWPLSSLLALVREVERSGFVDERWRFANRSKVSIWDRVFLVRQGKARHGILGYGRVTGLPSKSVQWQIPIRFEALVDPSKGVLATAEELNEITREKKIWGTMSSGVILPDDVAKDLEALVVGRDLVPTGAEGKAWTDREVEITVVDYFDMLLAESEGRDYSKSQHREQLGKQLPVRSNHAIELKHQNISAILIEAGLPYIAGYKPRSHYQRKLAEQVDRFVDTNPDLIARIEEGFATAPSALPAATRVQDVLVPAPPLRLASESSSPRKRNVSRVDHAMRDAANRRLGAEGEQFTVAFERLRLTEAKRQDLAAKVECVATSRGDGLGYDVLSFDECSGKEQFIEVKTTNCGAEAPFMITPSELDFARSFPERFRLYRVFEFKKRPRIFILTAEHLAGLHLEPTVFRAHLRKARDKQ